MAPVDANFRNNVQGDLFSRGFPKIHETYYFFSIVQETVFPQKLTDLGKSNEISNLTKVLDDWKKVDATPKGEIIDVCNALIAFSMEGLRKIQAGLGGDDLKLAKIKISDPAFFLGMKQEDPSKMHDPPLEEWHPLFGQDIHGLLKIAGSDPAIINTKLHNIKAILGHGTVINDIVYSSEPTTENSRVDGQVRPKDKQLNGREHFGFEDAISQPLLEGIDDIDRPAVFAKDVLMHTAQRVITASNDPPGLHPKPEAQGNAFKRPDWMFDGSFLVFRKLEQDVAGFNKFIEQNHAKAHCDNAPLFAAKLMGRWPSVAQVHPSSCNFEKDIATDPKGDNSFKFTDNRICPMAAHIRKMNPRDDDLQFALNARIIRSGIPYGKEYSEAPTNKRGLLFACYQSSIDNGFRFLQIAWANKDNFPRDNAGYDVFVAQRGPHVKLTCNFEGEDHKVTTISDISSLVTMKGGEYFFVPSIYALTSKLGKA
ncbi:hypothetical protein A1O7_02532 [Cladophialophora yegresii CBS 114405]|uniref:Dyp-type peroxidase n=1 Tax=Cladophialophora yegresii CBS 114405 TaxID=1182544 RepID=W9WUW2_9EURO|nr:uncharacterized protein A1O7_02532 [Cladophialophora yegresii CBS 114405]EXJ62099.1 hypothetical protein A1O7_02532 [Cladophialophora yegresii CBS 114405]